jgi:hypothetical protein
VQPGCATLVATATVSTSTSIHEDLHGDLMALNAPSRCRVAASKSTSAAVTHRVRRQNTATLFARVAAPLEGRSLRVGEAISKRAKRQI